MPRWCDNCGCQSEHLKFGLCPKCYEAPFSYDARTSVDTNSSSDTSSETGPSIVRGFLTKAYYWKEGIQS